MKTSAETASHYTWGDQCDGWHLFRSEPLSVIRERMPPATAELWHFHEQAQQVFYILSGTALIETEKDSFHAEAGESIAVEPRQLHRICNRTNLPLEFLLVSAPMAQGDRIEFIDYAPEYRDFVKKLNYEWLEKYFRVEAEDAKSLSDPEKEILAKNGFIYFVRVNNEIIGTASLLFKEPGVFELGKMAVTGNARGKGIGKKLIEFCLLMAKIKGARTMILYSNRRLVNAIHLYRKYGFEEAPVEPGIYERADIKMTREIQ